ncbi:hypothetical protein M0802_014246 [Mischocyttarus mexicanus]|nr:hypothetical protein M0802_014246 [Mischocyttarus mexicanus]
MNFCGKYTKKDQKILRDCDLIDDDQSVVSEESDAEVDSFSDDSEADFFATLRRNGDDASGLPLTTDSERIIDDDDMCYDTKEKLIEFAFDDGECGIKMNADRNSSAKDIFDQLFSRNIVQTLFRNLLIQSLIGLPHTEISGKNLVALTPTRGRAKQKEMHYHRHQQIVYNNIS